MRRIDVLLIGLIVFLAGGFLYGGLRVAGLDASNAGIWSQAVLIAGLLGWVVTYGLRALNQTMTYNQQLKAYEDAVLQKRLEEMTPEQLAQLQQEVEETPAAAADADASGEE
ncbi:hypothetical protein XM38_030010 [Halomicronema hongdechloris C2206]|uniref:DUF3007 domain-containing protein n=1 Tax=Halomicronema hongdechloris C2206 TaxID=1641165 RepID=A0A1Z3HPF1_9CYAN|nr:DUF3007 family protein [Halomicronema hongdechloris]ASC72047.1 hypothetical protein XM38_030010 [Halomicronema hongdechloris C2206]